MFVNVCSHPRIDPVCGANLQPVSEEHLDTWGLGNARVPLLVGPTRAMLDSDGRDATAVDVLFHPAVVRRALTGGKSVTKEHFRDYLMDIATKNILEDHDIALAPGRTVPLEVAKYKGPNGENKDNTHAFPVFPEGGAEPSPPEEPAPMTATSERSSPSSSLSSSSGGASSGSSVRSQSRNATPASDARASSTRARSMKKGFLSAGGKGESAELYPDGSAEGIPKPGEQYDPLGHIPESVRNKCHVIDTGALKGAELEKVSRQYAETGRLDLNAPGVYAKGSAPGGKREVGIGHPSAMRTGGTETGTEAGTETGTEGDGAGRGGWREARGRRRCRAITAGATTRGANGSDTRGVGDHLGWGGSARGADTDAAASRRNGGCGVGRGRDEYRCLLARVRVDRDAPASRQRRRRQGEIQRETIRAEGDSSDRFVVAVGARTDERTSERARLREERLVFYGYIPRRFSPVASVYFHVPVKSARRANPATQHPACRVSSARHRVRSVCGPRIRRKRLTRFMFVRVSPGSLDTRLG